jgi:putative SOS response-associated peptidase YedK
MLEFRSLSKMLDRLRWDLVPYWAKDEKSPSKQSLHGLRRSKIAKKRRCLISANGFYEWNKVIGGNIPYWIEMTAAAVSVSPMVVLANKLRQLQ